MNTHMVHREGSEGVRVEEKEGGGDSGEAGTREEHRRGHRSPVTGRTDERRRRRWWIWIENGRAEQERETERAAAGERIRLGFGRGMRRGRTAYIRWGERGAWGRPVPGGLPSWAVSPTGPPPGCIMHRAVPRARPAAQARARRPSGRAKTTGHGPGRRAAGCMAKYR